MMPTQQPQVPLYKESYRSTAIYTDPTVVHKLNGTSSTANLE